MYTTPLSAMFKIIFIYFSILVFPIGSFAKPQTQSESKAIMEIKKFMANFNVKAKVDLKKNFVKDSPANIYKDYLIEISDVNLRGKQLESFSSSVIPMSCYIVYSNLFKNTETDIKKIKCKITSRELIEKKGDYTLKKLSTASLCLVNALEFAEGLIIREYQKLISSSNEGVYDKSSAKELIKYFRAYAKKNGEIRHTELSGFHFYTNYKDKLRFQAYIFINRDPDKEVHKLDIFVDTETKKVVGLDM